MARRSKQTRAEIERQLLREIMALDEPYINLTDRKVPFDADMCQRIEDNEVLEYGEDGLEVPRGYIVLTTGRDLFMDFIRFYDHDVPRTFGFDRDPRRAYAEKYGGKDLYKLSGRDKLNRRQWDMLERYEASEDAPRLLDDYKDEQGELRSGLISVVADKLQQTAAQADPTRRRKPNVRKEAQRKIREISKIFGGLDLGSLEKEHIRQARKYVLASKNGVYLVPSARLFSLVGVPLTREATREERRNIATGLATDEFKDVVYGEDGEDMDPQGAFYRALPFVISRPYLKTRVLDDPLLSTEGVRRVAKKIGLDDGTPISVARERAIKHLRRGQIRQFYQLAEILGVHKAADSRLLAERERYIDAQPFTDEGEDAALLAQCLYCAKVTDTQAEIKLFPEAAQLLADSLRDYVGFLIESDVPDDLPRRRALVEDAQTSREELLDALRYVYGECYVD